MQLFGETAPLSISQLFRRVKLEIRMRLFFVTPDHLYNWLYPDWQYIHAYLRQRPDQYLSFIWENELFPSSHRAEVLQKPEACLLSEEYWIFFSMLYITIIYRKAWPRYPGTSDQSISSTNYENISFSTLERPPPQHGSFELLLTCCCCCCCYC